MERVRRQLPVVRGRNLAVFGLPLAGGHEHSPQHQKHPLSIHCSCGISQRLAQLGASW